MVLVLLLHDSEGKLSLQVPCRTPAGFGVPDCELYVSCNIKKNYALPIPQSHVGLRRLVGLQKLHLLQYFSILLLIFWPHVLFSHICTNLAKNCRTWNGQARKCLSRMAAPWGPCLIVMKDGKRLRQNKSKCGLSGTSLTGT